VSEWQMKKKNWLKNYKNFQKSTRVAVAVSIVPFGTVKIETVK
jgi:hypothetical protein